MGVENGLHEKIRPKSVAIAFLHACNNNNNYGAVDKWDFGPGSPGYGQIELPKPISALASISGEKVHEYGEGGGNQK